MKTLFAYPPPYIPVSFRERLPARLEDDGHGGAVMTVGAIRSPFANADLARAQLKAMEARGMVYLEPEEGRVC